MLLTSSVLIPSSIPIFITQTTGYGHSFESLTVAKTIMQHCASNNLICLNSAKELDLRYEDFYDESHLNIKGSKKLANYIFEKLPIF